MRYRPVLIPKTGSTSLAEFFGVLHQHARASTLEGPRFALLRHPVEWSFSWYRHVAKWGDSNERCHRALLALGHGDTRWEPVFEGMSHLETVDISQLPAEDHLFSPGGLVGVSGSMWARHYAHWLDAPTALVAFVEAAPHMPIRNPGPAFEDPGTPTPREDFEAYLNGLRNTIPWSEVAP